MSVKKNKQITKGISLTLIIAVCAAILCNSDFIGVPAFNYMQLEPGRDPLSVGATLFYYVLLWGIIGMISSSLVFLVALGVYLFLHRKDKNILNRGYYSNYEDELYDSSFWAMRATYIAVSILLLLNIFNIVHIRIF